MSRLPADHPFSIASLTSNAKRKGSGGDTRPIITSGLMLNSPDIQPRRNSATGMASPPTPKYDLENSDLKSPMSSTGSADCSLDISFGGNVSDCPSHPAAFHDDRSDISKSSSRSSSPAASEDSGRGSPVLPSPVREDEAGRPSSASSTPPPPGDDPSDKPAHSYIALISMAILASPEKKLVLSDIYQNIMDNYPYYNNQERAWRNSIRHNLSLNECFIKAGRADNGKGNFWGIHPACVEDFSKGDFRRRQARRRARATVATADQMAAFALRCGTSYSPMVPSAVSALHSYMGASVPGLSYIHAAAAYNSLYANTELQTTTGPHRLSPPPSASANSQGQYNLTTKIPSPPAGHLLPPSCLTLGPGGRPILNAAAMRNSLMAFHHGHLPSPYNQETPSIRYSPYARPSSHIPPFW